MKTDKIYYINLTKAQVVLTTHDNKKYKMTRLGSFYSDEGVYPGKNRLEIAIDRSPILYTDCGIGIPLCNIKTIGKIKERDYWVKRQAKLVERAFFGLLKIHEILTLEEDCKPPKELI